MSRHLLLPLLLALQPALFSGVAAAKVPDPNQSSVEPVLVGNSTGLPAGNGFVVIVRDVAAVPISGATVTLSFSGTGMSPYAEQVPGTSVNCANKLLSKVTDLEGRAVFTPRIGGFENGANIPVRANGVLLRFVPGRSTDLNGNGETDIMDQLLFFQNRFYDQLAPETDYDESGATTILDQLIFFEERFSRARGTPCS